MEQIGNTLARIQVPAPSSPTASTPSGSPDVCGRCGGVGWLRSDATPDKPTFGQLVPCPCGLVRNRRLARLDQTFGFTEGLRGVELASLRAMRGQGDALKATLAYSADPRGGWLYLHGAFGCGKTTLMAGVVNQTRRAGTEAVFVVVPELLNWLRACFEPGSSRSYEEDWAYIRAVPLLALDDLGTEKATGWSDERLYELFNWRYRQELPTVVTSNIAPGQMRDARLASRLSDVMLCKVVAAGDMDIRRVQR